MGLANKKQSDQAPIKTRLMRAFFTVLFSCLGFHCCQAQILGESPIPGVLINFDYNFQLPAADMAKRFGKNSSIGFGVHYKFENNWMFGLEGDFLFGTIIKQDSFVANLMTGLGAVIGTNGEEATILVQERGFIISPKISRLIPLRKENQNSGLLLQFGIGYMQHRIKIVDRDNIVPQLSGEYVQGYDRLSGGLALSQFVGYQNLDRNKLLNFYVGIEVIEGITNSMRDYHFDIKRGDNATRFDLLFGLKAGWILPIYGKRDDDYYYH